MTERRAIFWLISATFCLRLAFAGSLGLGVDESYVVAAGRLFQWGYFDHPPAMWWLERASVSLFGSEAALVVRLPFLLIFAATTWGLYRLGALLFGEKAGLWSAILLNLSPVLGVTSASWVLPDGPLNCALVFSALALAHVFFGQPRQNWRNWVVAGLTFGLAIFSKYISTLTGFGALIAIFTWPMARKWLARPQLYVAALLALTLFAPVLIWNGAHDWASLAFQSGRGAAHNLRPAMMLATIGGQALYMLPWIWALLIWRMGVALRDGPLREDGRRWFLACLGLPPILLFTLVSLWSPGRVLPHWTAPGYLLLLPLGGEWAARHAQRLRPYAVATAGLLLGLAAFLVADLRFGLLPASPGVLHLRSEIGDWSNLKPEIERRGLLAPQMFVGTGSFILAGKIGYALGPEVPLTILQPDRREFAFSAPVKSFAGKQALILDSDPDASLYAPLFDRLEARPDLDVIVAGQKVETLHVWIGTNLKP